MSLQIVSESDMMRAILQELGGVPNVLYQEGQTAPVTFALSNRFAQVMGQLSQTKCALAAHLFLQMIHWQPGKPTGYKPSGTSSLYYGSRREQR